MPKIKPMTNKTALAYEQDRPGRPPSKLSRRDVQMIRALAEAGLTHESIARKFDVSRRHVTDIVNGNRWKDE